MDRERLLSGNAWARILDRTVFRPLRARFLRLADGIAPHRIGWEDAGCRLTRVPQKPVLQIGSERPTLQPWDPASTRPRSHAGSSRSLADGATAMRQRSLDAKAHVLRHRGPAI